VTRRLARVALIFACLAACDGNGKIEPAPEPAAFTPDPEGEGPTVFLRGRSAGSHLLVDVVAKGTPDVNGAALRVVFDPSALAFVEATPGPPWSRVVVSLAKEGTPGQLAITWAEKGAIGFAANAETVLGTLTFQKKSTKASSISFRADRSSIVDRKGVAAAIAFRGGSVPAR
jgi:hypothetical protein